MSEPRPVFLDVRRIGLPVGALTSILHRVTGLILALGMPLGAYLLDLSLRGPDGYARATSLLVGLPARIATVLLAWALAHHLLAGIRHVFGDIDIGSRLHAARRSAWAVNVSGLAIGLLAGAALL